MPSTILSDNGVSSGSAGLKTTAASDGSLALQTTTAGGTATTALTIDTSQNITSVGNIRLNNGAADGAQLILASSGYSDWNIDNYSGNFRWYYNASEYMRLDASGNLGLGTTSPDSSSGYVFMTTNGSSGSGFHAQFNGTTVTKVEGVTGGTNITAEGARNIQFYTNSTERASIDSAGSITFGSGGGYGYIKQFGSYLGFGNGNTALMFLDESSTTRRIIPRQNNNNGSDNNIDLGDGGSRFRTLYAGTGSINTSDAREKTAVTPLTSNELAAAMQLASEIGTYQWLDSVSAKGDNARRHVGMTVQRAIEIMRSFNLDTAKYAFICHDTWAEETNDEGEVTKAAGDRYSFRPDQLNMFISRGQQAIIEQLQADVAALKGTQS